MSCSFCQTKDAHSFCEECLTEAYCGIECQKKHWLTNHKEECIGKRARAGARQRKIRKVMEEFKRGTLRTSSGKRVTNRKQAIAIALSEARRK